MSTDQSAPSHEKELLLDELDEKFAAFQAFRKSDTAAADEILGSLGAHDEVDRTIVLELSSPSPLGHPDRFPTPIDSPSERSKCWTATAANPST